ncbi:MAG: hypothetical protein KAW47_07205 [Thermoplasmatales archaeon]|nr:hypothetical protein [Thermoplasmatales archaeon]
MGAAEKMKIPKNKALELIDEKISQFQKVLAEATYNNRYNEAYKLAYQGTETLLTELFSKEEATDFRSSVAIPRVAVMGAVMGGEIDYAKRLQDYKNHVNSCIAKLNEYRERIQIFWATNELETVTKSTVVPFVSMRFDESDQDINQYVTGLLKALQIDFEMGERYSKDSIPQKVQNRIRNSDPFIIIFVKRDKIEGGGYTTPSWLLKELGIAQGAQKEVIAWVERDIKDIAGLNYEKEVIYFERNNAKEIEKATIKFLEALKEHKLI